MPSGELSTTGIVHDALRSGKQVYIPYIHTIDKTSVMDMLALQSMTEFESLQPDKWGIPSLQVSQLEGRQNGLTQGLDLIVMPGMAFDHGFRRLGHGKGYYDHFLTQYSKQTSKMPFLGKKSPTNNPFISPTELHGSCPVPPRPIALRGDSRGGA
jgi:5-formyltetrahydrofolate cyclo-ligase